MNVRTNMAGGTIAIKGTCKRKGGPCGHGLGIFLIGTSSSA